MSPNDGQPGLRMRLAHEGRRLAAQHEFLDVLAKAASQAVERDGKAEAREALHGFRAALDAHFALEEQMHFPALRGLHPELADELAELVREHAEFRASLDRLEGGADGVERKTALDALVAGLRLHETREERMLDGADGSE